MVAGGLAPKAIAALGQARALTDATPEAQLPVWFALWVDADPANGIEALETKLLSLDRAAGSAFAEQFLGALAGDRSGGGAVIGAWRTASCLHRLYVLMHNHIRVAEDIDRSGGGVHSPTTRDDAQHARDRLFNLLADMPGEPTYRAIQALAIDHPEVEYRAYMRRAARHRATADSERTWTEQEVRNLVNRLCNPR